MNKKKLEKMLKLADIKPNINESVKELSTIESVKKALDGKSYAIVRENSKYFIKVSDKKENLTESDFDYIGGVKNKPKYSYNSFSEATRNLNFVFDEINRTHGGDNVNILESDDEMLGEKKYVLKQKKSEPTPDPEPEMDFGDEKGFDFGDGDEGDETEDNFDFGDDDEEEEDSEDFDFGDEEEEDSEEDPIKNIQKTTGKLGQKLRDTEDISPDMTKWVAKSVMSALNLDSLENSDKKEIIKNIKKSKEDEDSDGDFDFGGDEDMEESYDSYMDDDSEDPNVLTKDDLYGANESYDSYMDDDEDLYYQDDVSMSDIDMPIKDKGYLNLDDPTAGNPYDSYMNDEEDYAKSYADKDIRSHYHKPSFDDMDRGHALDYDDVPYPNRKMMDDMTFLDDEMSPGHRRGQEIPHDDEVLYDSYMDDDMSEDDESYQTIEDELGLPPAGPEVDETDYQRTPTMGESIDSIDTLKEILDIDEDELNDDDMDIEMRTPAPSKEPDTKPAPTKEPDKDKPSRPSKRPFTPPPHIRPSEEPGPKAGDEDDSDVEFE